MLVSILGRGPPSLNQKGRNQPNQKGEVQITSPFFAVRTISSGMDERPKDQGGGKSADRKRKLRRVIDEEDSGRKPLTDDPYAPLRLVSTVHSKCQTKWY
jgi:hypothetical protein